MDSKISELLPRQGSLSRGGPWDVTNQSIIVWTLKTKSLLPPFTKGRNSPLWERGVRGDFQKNMSNQLWTPQ
jgi:hypothetical protein